MAAMNDLTVQEETISDALAAVALLGPRSMEDIRQALERALDC